ncbi:MAG: UvrD-helicase domain-containing protein [Terracidiphilus sp.]|jgi:ATP-dependent exoDNAse (exonuclease V) beta subunit
MSKSATPPDQIQRDLALDPTRSILVQAPAGSGKTTLLTQRFLVLLAEVDDPGQVVAITFTNAAAAEMRNRVLDELRSPEPTPIALRALARSNAHGWNLLDLPAQLRISTIDGFCRDLALQQPLLSGLGGGLNIAEQPEDLYRRAARLTLEAIGSPTDPALSTAIEALLAWRDNNWQEVENQLVEMLARRDKWMHDFLIERDPDWDDLRQRLERPFANAVRDGLTLVSQLLDQVPGAREESLELARFACTQPGGERHRELAELADFPIPPFPTHDHLEEAHQALKCLAGMLLTQDGGFRKSINKTLGFPADRKFEKARITQLIADLDVVPGLESALAGVRALPPARYPEDDWLIVRACFTVLRHAAGQLKVVFAETAKVDFIEVAQVALASLKSDDGFPSEAALTVADGIRHLLVDEFQDTSRRQYELLAALIAAWPDSGTARAGRTLFAVGDPMQSIYFFRDADTELFTRTKEIGLEIPNSEPLVLQYVPLTANFRTTPPLVKRLNDAFTQVFSSDDGSGITFTCASPFRDDFHIFDHSFKLHLNFEEQNAYKKALIPVTRLANLEQKEPQSKEVLDVIHSFKEAVENANASGGKFRIAVLARARKSLVPIAKALREAQIPFRAVELEKLAARPEILDALALAQALLSPLNRVAWLGVLRAPWCGLTLADLHLLTSADDPGLLARPIPDLLVERQKLLSGEGRQAVRRVLQALDSVSALRASQPTASLGTCLQQIWQTLGGAACVDATASANLDLLWTCLDHLPGGEQDLLGPALDAALDKLTALPDPAASSDCGVQLMTIHKSKGLEFEVVIVPDLQAGARSGKQTMLSWLERGLAEPDDSGEITEFLIAPQQSKGEDKGKSKAWVDRVYRERESQEDRRILYVAATRARDQLHLFARPAYRQEKDGSLTLCEPANSLLSTAWPALEPEVRAAFDNWVASRDSAPADIATIAAESDTNLAVMPSPPKPAILRRLPPDYQSGATIFHPGRAQRVEGPASPPVLGGSLYTRHEGGLLSRALGIAVHFLLEELARLRTSHDWPASRAALQRFEPRIAARLRALGVDQAQAATLAAEALRLALNASNDRTAQWILSPHAGAAAEVRWAGVISGSVSTVRVDRVFRAGLTPESEGEQAWWIVDYKAAHAGAPDPATALPGLRGLFAPQLETYARFLRNLHGHGTVIRTGLYYPRMLIFDWWET